MPNALNRLLEHPSALRLLRSIIRRNAFPSLKLPQQSCCRYQHSIAARPNEALREISVEPRPANRLQDGTAPQVGHVGLTRIHGVTLRKRDRQQEVLSDTGDHRAAASLESPLPFGEERIESEYMGLRDPEKLALTVQKMQTTNNNEAIRELWFGLRRSHVDLPTSGSQAKFIWETFIADVELRRVVVRYALNLHDRTGQQYEHLLSSIIVRDISRPKRALSHYNHLVAKWSLAPRTMKRIASALPLSSSAIGVFKTIYEASNQHDVYDALISRFLDHGLRNLARHWHRTLCNKLDVPSLHFILHLHPEFVKTLDPKESKRLRTVALGQPRRTAQVLVTDKPFVAEAGPSLATDKFCARLFATHFLPFEAAVGLSKMRGANSLGPLAFRQLVLRRSTGREILECIKKLQLEGLTLDECVYTKAIKVFARSGRDDLWRCLVESDKHPDVFEKAETLRKMLHWHVAQRDDKEAELILNVLTLAHPERAVTAWNLVLQVRAEQLKNEGPTPLSRIIDDMLAHRIVFSTESLEILRLHILRPRRKFKQPQRPTGYLQDIRYLTNIYRRIMMNGQEVDSALWVELLVRLGLSFEQPEFERLSTWLIYWYRHGRKFRQMTWFDWRRVDPSLQFPDNVSRPYSAYQTLRQIFTPAMTRGIVYWGFKRALTWPRPFSLESLQGLSMLKRLCDKGLPVGDRFVADVLSQMLGLLFKQRSVYDRKWKRTAQRFNPDSWLRLVASSRKIWGRRLRISKSYFPGGNPENTRKGVLSKREKLLENDRSVRKRSKAADTVLHDASLVEKPVEANSMQ